MENYKCPICGNTDIHSIGCLKGKPYCRKCLTFRGQEANGDYIQSNNYTYTLHYELSNDQKRLSEQLVENYKNHTNSLVCAVCGSGKTEICLAVISYCIKHKLSVGFAVPRTNVCVELFNRFKNFFIKNKVISVYGGHHDVLEGDLIVLTAHQLFRYRNYFDLLIMDEIDAYPFKGNDVLEHMFKNSVRGNYILMSATPSKDIIDKISNDGGSVLSLYSRFHQHPLPVPKVKIGNVLKLYYNLLNELHVFLKQNKQVFIFVPTIDLSINISLFLKLFFHKGTYVNSKRKDAQKVIDDFRKNKYQYLVTTAVLERGVTVKDLQVIVFKADHPIYDSASLIQIAGRVGRKKDAPEGEVIFLARENNKQIEGAVAEINTANKKLQDMLQRDQNS